jgi:hypothetical protein
VRSSARIPKQIPVLLIGSDLDGRMFSERTSTVLLSLHGAGLLSRHKLSPEQELILRWPEKNKETDIRVVGHIGEDSGQHTYGVAFFDLDLNFWEIDFPPISEMEKKLGVIILFCTSCFTREEIDDTSVEADVCATNDSVLRTCKRCGIATLWKPVSSSTAPPPQPTASSQLPLFSAAAIPPPLPAPAPAADYNPVPAGVFVPPLVPSAPQPSFYAQTPGVAPDGSSSSSFRASRPDPDFAGDPALTGFGDPSAQPLTAVLTLAPPSPDNSAAAPQAASPAPPRANRRKHPRVKVSYSACIRHPERDDDIVTCDDMSKGGLRFKSPKQYYPQSLIEVAVPYDSKGQHHIFVPARIVFVEPLPEQSLFRYGVQYLQPTKPRASF